MRSRITSWRILLPVCLLCVACVSKGSERASAAGTPTETTTGPSPVTPVGAFSSNVQLLEDFRGRPLFPADNWWNQDISGAPVDPASGAYINWIGASDTLHPDFGPPPYGLPYITVGRNQPRVTIGLFKYASESDAGVPGEAPGYPIPDEARTMPNYIEGALPGGGDSGDRHMLIVDRDRWILYELYAAKWNAKANYWEAGGGAIFDLSSNARRPEGWTSSDAAGLAVLPGLVRYDEVFGAGDIRHAFRLTLRDCNGYVWPASHVAGRTPGAPPLGMRMRLKAHVDLSGFSAPTRKIFEAMKRYGLIFADNGEDMYITGTMDARWNNDDLNPAFRRLRASDFEVVQLGWR
jgi:hypothetical protein